MAFGTGTVKISIQKNIRDPRFVIQLRYFFFIGIETINFWNYYLNIHMRD